MQQDVFELGERLARHGQDHLLEGLDDLDPDLRAAFLERLGRVDWEELAHPTEPPTLAEIGRSRVVDFAERAARADEWRPLGARAYRAGEVAVLMVAGGMGTRLGFDGPKGCFAIGAHSGKSIYQLQAEKVLAASRRYGRELPFLVMTSPATDAETRAYFAANGDFGCAPGQVRFFRQGTVPSLDRDGRALLAAPGRLLENPDGHGGCFAALCESGRLDELRREGIEHLVYLQVDNILAPVDDPLLVGLAAQEEADVVTKVLPKAHPDERVGHLVRVDGRDRIIEYTELTPGQTRETGPDGEPVFRWGSPAMWCWGVGFLARQAAGGARLPLHRSRKPLHAWTPDGPVEVDGWKCERFIFDLLPLAERSLGLAIDRAEEFAPVKNAEGDDSPATARALHSECCRRWLADVGVEVDLPAGAVIEISPRFAATAEEFHARWDGRVARVSGDYYLEG